MKLSDDMSGTVVAVKSEVSSIKVWHLYYNAYHNDTDLGTILSCKELLLFFPISHLLVSVTFLAFCYNQ